tara:strand:- start:201 stop:854 length:654 start_codon:yes stop_codon:yes gene_type:complete
MKKKYKLLNFNFFICFVFIVGSMVSTGMFLFLLIYFIYYEIRNWRLKFYYSYDFYLSKQEEKEYNSLKKNFNDILLKAKKVENSLLSYLVQGRSVKKNKNGSYSARTSLGKKLNRVIPELQRKLNIEIKNVDKIEKELDEYENLPQEKAKKYIYFSTMRNMLRFTVLTLFIFNFIILAILSKEVSNEYLGGFIIFQLLATTFYCIWYYKKSSKEIYN